jgi:hypothetical protein
MTSTAKGYVVVDGKDDILLGTFAFNRRDSWKQLTDSLRLFGVNRRGLMVRGYKCVRVELRTEDYQR